MRRVKSRRIGVEHAWVSQIIYDLNQGLSVMCVSNDISRVLARLDFEVDVEEMTRTTPPEMVYNEWAEPIGLDFSKKIITGYLIKKK